MDSKDMNKLQDAGFTLYRVDLREKRIRKRSASGSWVVMENFPTQKATQEKHEELRQLPTWINT